MASRPEPDSPKLRALQRALRRRPRSAAERFWAWVARTGTPIVEPVKDDPSRSWVTYLWRDRPGTRGVAVFTPQTEWGEFDRMTRLPRSDVWYRTSSVRNDCFGAYCILPNPPEDSPKDLTGFLTVLKRGKPDPLNPERFDSPQDPEFPDHPVYGARMSALRLKDAPRHREVIRVPDRPAGSVRQYWLRSRILKNRRRIWTYTPPETGRNTAEPRLVIFFDGFAYVNELAAPTTLDNLIANGRIPPTYALFVDALDMKTRGRELPGNPDFGRFLVRELLPWSRRVLGRAFPARRTTLAGFSYGGLCSLYWALHRPQRFQSVISQSGSFWWSPKGTDEPVALAREFMRRPRLPLRIYMDAGRYEGSAAKENGSGQLGSNRHIRDVLRLKGYPVLYRTYNGGHDTYCWRETLVDALPWALT